MLGSRVASQRLLLPKLQKNFVTYVQGQSPQPRIREYFYYVDHQGMVFFILLFYIIFISYDYFNHRIGTNSYKQTFCKL